MQSGCSCGFTARHVAQPTDPDGRVAEADQGGGGATEHMGSGIPHGVDLPPASVVAVEHVAGSSDEDAKVVLAYDCFSEAVVGLPLAGGGGAKEHMGDGPHGVDLRPASVGADKHLHGDEDGKLPSLALQILRADKAWEGMSVTDVWAALDKPVAEAAVEQALASLVLSGEAFNTTCDERFAAV